MQAFNSVIAEETLLQSGTGVMVLGAQGKVLFWNQWMAKHTGLASEAVIGKTIDQVFDQDLPMRFIHAVRQALEAGQSSVLSHTINPTTLPLFTGNQGESSDLPHAIRIKSLVPNQEERCCLVEVTDMRAALQREQLLRSQGRDLRLLAQRHEEQSKYARALVDSTQDAQVTINAKGQVRDLNPAARSLFGIECNDHLNVNIDQCLPQVDQFAPKGVLGRSLPPEQPFELEAVKSDGTVFPAEISMSAFTVKQAPHYLLVIRDLSQRKAFEESLYRERDFAQATLRSINEAVITTDTQGRISSANAAAASLLRTQQDIMLGRPVMDLVTFLALDQRRQARSALAAALEQAESFEFDESNAPELRFEDGESLYLAGRISPLYAADQHVVGCLLVLRDVTMRRRMNELLTYQATHDDLTSLINRREFERVLNTVIDQGCITGSNILLYLDLDQFKLINDTCGHNAGDQLLKQLTGLMRTRLRHTDTLARLGGDEFAVLLPNCDLAIGKRIAEELRRTVNEYRFHWQERAFALGVSIGLVEITASMDSLTIVLAAADSACYIAKDQGRDQVVVYHPDGSQETQRRSEMTQASQVSCALEQDRFVLYCQPIVPIDDTDSGNWGVEVLVRMRDEQGEIVPPMAFIPAAERYDLMSHIDRWVIHAVCQHWSNGAHLLAHLEKVAINLSGQSIANDEFLQYVIETVESHGVPWSKLCFEITETAAVASIEKAQAFMSTLSEKGCRFALDDFGSGLSSFTYLKHLSVDYLKIDGAFVRDMLVDEIDAAMVRSISDVGAAMGLETIAEFVENPEVIAALNDSGVNWAQGYGICKPIPLDELDEITFEHHQCASTSQGT